MTLSMRSFDVQGLIRRCVGGGHLTSDEMRDAIGWIMDGQASHAQISALLVALSAKGETTEELVGAARAMRERAVSVRSLRQPLVDVCGTGGDGLGTFNISTAVAFLVAGAGIAVAKHGNRAMSSRCGSADVLDALGMDLNSSAHSAEAMLKGHGIAFLFAQAYHPAMRFVTPVRRDIGIRTIFNLLGPLTNPAHVTHQVVGVAHEGALTLMAQALRALGRSRAAVVCAADGMDEVSLSCPTRVLEWTGERFAKYVIEPEMVGLSRRPLGDVAGGDPQHNAELITHVLWGRPGAHRDIVVLNAALALYIAGAAQNLGEGVRLAQASIDSGAGHRALVALTRTTP